MKKPGKTTRATWVTSAVVAPFLVVFVVASAIVFRQMRQEQLDYALVHAAKQLDAPKVERLLNEGANANTLETDVPPPTWQTLWKRLLARLQGKPISRKAGAKPVLYRLLFDSSPWFYAVLNEPDGMSRVDTIAAALLVHGADVPLHDDIGMTPLMNAAYWGVPHSCRALIARGAEVNAKDSSGYTALMIAHGDTLKELVNGGADVNAVDWQSDSVLMKHLGSRADVEFLVEHGADVNRTDSTRWSAMYYLYEMRHSGAVSDKDFGAVEKLLKQHGARLDAQDRAKLRHNRVPIP